jgi:RNA polymerase sigma-70 factor (ECF subfamily)
MRNGSRGGYDLGMRAHSRDAIGAHRTPPPPRDRASRRWTEQLRAGHPRRDETVAALHEVLLRSASHELFRRSAQLGTVRGPEFDDLAQQAADDALVKILANLEQFAGRSRFTTWAYKFVIFETSRLVSRHAWQRERPLADESAPRRAAASVTADPAQSAERREQFALLATAVVQLTARQREVFVAVALNDVPIDVLAIELGSNRNAVYKNLFDARRSLRMSMAAGGHPVFPEDRVRD